MDNENVRASIKLFELAKDYEVKKIIFPSSFYRLNLQHFLDLNSPPSWGRGWGIAVRLR